LTVIIKIVLNSVLLNFIRR